MVIPTIDSLSLADAAFSNNSWFVTDLLQFLASRNINTLKKINFDYIGILNLDLSEITISNSVEKIKASFIDFERLLNVLQQISGFYKSKSYSNLDIQIANLTIYNAIKANKLDELSSEPGLVQIIQEAKNSIPQEYFQNSFYNFYIASIKYSNLETLLIELGEIFSLLQGLSDNELAKSFEIWQFYKAFVKLPEEVFSYIDDISISGFLTRPTLKQKEKSYIDANVNITLHKTAEQIEKYFIEMEESKLSKSLIKNLNKLQPYIIESIYNLTQIVRASDKTFGGKIELFYNGNLFEYDSKLFSETFISINPIIEALDSLEEETTENNIIDLLASLVDLGDDILSTYIEYFDELHGIVGNIFKAIYQMHYKYSVNLFGTTDNITVFSLIYNLNYLVFPLYNATSGTFDILLQEKAKLYQNISTAINSFYTTRLQSLKKLQDKNYVNSLIEQRSSFYKSIILNTLQKKISLEDPDLYIEKLFNITTSLNISTPQYTEDLFKDFNQLKAELISLSQKVMNEYLKELGISPDSKKFEALQVALSYLNKIGLSMAIQQEPINITITVDDSILKNYLQGFRSTKVIDDEYIIDNLLAFGLAKI